MNDNGGKSSIFLERLSNNKDNKDGTQKSEANITTPNKSLINPSPLADPRTNFENNLKSNIKVDEAASVSIVPNQDEIPSQPIDPKLEKKRKKYMRHSKCTLCIVYMLCFIVLAHIVFSVLQSLREKKMDCFLYTFSLVLLWAQTLVITGVFYLIIRGIKNMSKERLNRALIIIICSVVTEFVCIFFWKESLRKETCPNIRKNMSVIEKSVDLESAMILWAAIYLLFAFILFIITKIYILILRGKYSFIYHHNNNLLLGFHPEDAFVSKRSLYFSRRSLISAGAVES
jgi:cation transport ATPase